jgi:hypothetical protein
MNLFIQLLLVFFLLIFQFILIVNENNSVAESFNFAAVGDWGDNSETIKTAQNIDTKNVEVVLGLGDYAYEKNSNGIRSWWNNIEMVHDDEIFKGALGNAEIDDDFDENMYLELFNQSSWTYSFVYNGVLFVAINTEEDTSDEQKEKVIDMLKNSTEVDWKVVFFHRPILTSKTDNKPDPDIGVFAEKYCPVFKEYNVNLVLQAHNHNYQRSYVLDCSNNEFVKSEDSEGFTIANVGTGGRKLESQHVLEGMSPLMVTQCDDRIGFLNVDVVNKTQMKVQFIDNNGKIADTFEINKGNPVMNDITSRSCI